MNEEKESVIATECRAKTCLPAVWASGFALLNLLSFLASGTALVPAIWVRGAFFVGLTGALVLGIVALAIVLRSKERFRGAELAVVSIIVPLVLALYSELSMRSEEMVGRCAANLYGLGSALEVYAERSGGHYPLAQEWCDLLVEDVKVDKHIFVCPAAKGGACHYALNPNAQPNSPYGTVVLFETTGGWNQSGTAEVMSMQNHNGRGCNVLLNNGQVVFVLAEQIGVLSWGEQAGNQQDDSSLSARTQ
jgi:hypothetical protein